MCFFFIEETLPSKVAAKKAVAERKKLSSSTSPSFYGATDSSPSTSASTRVPSPEGSTSSTPGAQTPIQDGAATPVPLEAITAQEEAPKSILWLLMSKPYVRAVLASGFMFSFLGVGVEVVFVLYSYTRVDLGGMGRSPVQIGYALAGSGAVGTIVSLTLFPWLQRRFNNRKMYTFFAAFWALGFALMPLGNFAAQLAEKMTKQADREALMWAAIVFILTPVRIAVNVYPLNMIIVKSSVDSPDHLGSMFGLQQTCSSIARGIAPTFVSSLFAFSIDRHVMDGHFVWFVLTIISMVAVPMSMRVRDVPAPRSKLEDED